MAPTAAMLRDLQSAYSFSSATAVIANGRGACTVQVPKQPQIAAVGRVGDVAKNIAAAARAAAELGWPLLVAGEGDITGVQCLGRLSSEAVAELLAASSIFVEPARYEPFGLAALEAGLAGCALVLGDIPSLREVWGDAATYVDPDDEQALRVAVEGLIADPHLLRERSAAASARAAQYPAQTMAQRYLEQYGRLVAAPARQGAAT